MLRIFLVAVLLIYSAATFALSSTNHSALFTLDTVDPIISIESPNGGEECFIGDTCDIIWSIIENHPANNSTDLWYNCGNVDDIPLALGIQNTGTWAWSLPDIPSSNYRVRVGFTDLFGNSSLKSSDATFTITYAPPEAPQGVTVDISNDIDAVITWQPVTETIHGTPIIPDGYIVLYNETPYEDDDNLYYYLWDVTTGTTFTHTGVVHHRDQMYYRVIAYKDVQGRMAAILAKARAERPMSFAQIKEAMQNRNIGDEK